MSKSWTARPAFGRQTAGWLWLCLVLIWPATALAHRFDPGLLDLQTNDGRHWDATLHVATTSGRLAGELEPHFPDHCRRSDTTSKRRVGRRIIRHWTVVCSPPGLAGQTISIGGLQHAQFDILVRLDTGSGHDFTGRIEPTQPSIPLPDAFDTAKSGAAGGVLGTYLGLGFRHILRGFDHLLFVLGLCMLVETRRQLLKTITAFTAAHSLTLALSALHLVEVSSRPTEAGIAASILLLAVELVDKQNGRRGVTTRYPWAVSFGFGLLHGLGFAGALREIGLPDGDVPLALFSFNIGVEAGQLAVVAVILAVLAVVARRWPKTHKSSRLVAAYVLGAVSTYWLIERTGAILFG